MTARSIPSLRRAWSALALVLLVAAFGCGGREDAAGTEDPAANATAGSTAPAAATPSAAGEGALGLDEAQRAKLAALAEQKRAQAAGLSPGVTEIRLADGEESIELPDDYPEDVPLHPNANPTRYRSSPSRGTVTLLEIDESPDSARRYYQAALEEQGWVIDVDTAGGDLIMMTASKDGRSLAVALSEEDGMTAATLLETME